MDTSIESLQRIIAESVRKVHGVSSLSEGTFSMFKNEFFTPENQISQGIKISKHDELLNIDIFVIIKYGMNIPQLSWNIQTKVKKTLEEIGNINIGEINIHVQGVVHRRKVL